MTGKVDLFEVIIRRYRQELGGPAGLAGLAGLAIAAALALGFSGTTRAQTMSSADTPTGERYEQAALDFMTYCSPCHGIQGDGQGPVALELVTKPPNLALLTKRSDGVFPAEAVRRRVDGRSMPRAHGSAKMPVWGYWFTLQANAAGLLQEDTEGAAKEVKERIDRLVEYIKTLQK